MKLKDLIVFLQGLPAEQQELEAVGDSDDCGYSLVLDQATEASMTWNSAYGCFENLPNSITKVLVLE